MKSEKVIANRNDLNSEINTMNTGRNVCSCQTVGVKVYLNMGSGPFLALWGLCESVVWATSLSNYNGEIPNISTETLQSITLHNQSWATQTSLTQYKKLKLKKDNTRKKNNLLSFNK